MSSEEKRYFNAFARKQSLLGECNTFASELKNIKKKKILQSHILPITTSP